MKAVKEERGQAIVLIVFALVALLAVTGLAIDGGRLYQKRREVQNVADAVALAGTRVLASQRCQPGPNLDALVRDEIINFAAQNDLEHDLLTGRIWAWYVDKNENRLGVVGVGNVPNGTTGIEVSTQITDTTTFMRIVGQEDMSASGAATAMFGPVLQAGGGFLPIGFPVQQVEDIIASGTTGFTMFDGSGAICSANGVVCPSDPPAQSQRGWLNFNYIYNNNIHLNSYNSPLNRVISSSFSNADLKYWAEFGCPHPLFSGTRGGLPPYLLDGDFIVGDPGARESTRATICQTHMNKTVYLPVFDYIYERAEMQTAFPGNNEPPNPLKFPNSHFYHVVGFLAARLESCGSGNNKTLSGTFLYAVIGQGQITPGDGIQTGSGSGSGTCSPLLVGVTLWK